VLQVHTKAVVHTPTRTVVFDVTDNPYCTFDYQAFCEGLLEQSRVRFLRAAVKSCQGERVETTEGRFSAPIVVDCSGWRSVVSQTRDGDAGRKHSVSFGLETDTTYSGDALYFWASPPQYREGMAWLFPVGNGSRVGLGSYSAATKLKGSLQRFVEDLSVAPTTYHGTFFPSRLGRPTAGKLFVVGDAAGQCLPLTAEGIRPALFFGQECGRVIQRVLEGRLTLEQGLAAYRRQVGRYRWGYVALRLVQWAVTSVPKRWVGRMTELSARPSLMARWWPRYSQFGGLAPMEDQLGARSTR
jgi:flavin-dependent dehydrogenase